MKKTIVLVFALLCTQLLVSQTPPDIKWGKPIQEGKKIALRGIVGTDGENTYNLKIKYGFFSKLIIEHLDKNLNSVNSQELELSFEKNKMDYEYLIYRENELLLFTSFRNNKLKKNFLFVQHIDKKTLLSKGDIKKIAEIDYSNYGRWNTGNYVFKTSRDKSKFLVYYNLPYDKGTNEKFGFHVYGADNKQLWEKELTLPDLEENYALSDISIDNDANLQLVGRKYLGNKKERGTISNYNYEVLSFSKAGTKMKRYPINLTDKFITDLTISVNEEGDILCSGFYSERSTYSIAGTFFMKIEKETAKVKKQSFKAFDMNFITQNMTEKQEKKTKKKADKGKNIELYEYDLDEMILTSDGGAILIGEQYYVRVVTTTSTDSYGNTTTRTTYYYYYNDIIVVNISPEGDIKWAKKIPKHQVTTNDGGYYSSYFLIVDEDKLHFIFNDHIDNIIAPEPGKTKNFTGRKNGAVAYVTMDSNGNQTRKAFFRTKDAEVIIRPKVCKQVSAKSSIIYGEKKKVNQFGLIEY